MCISSSTKCHITPISREPRLLSVAYIINSVIEIGCIQISDCITNIANLTAEGGLIICSCCPMFMERTTFTNHLYELATNAGGKLSRNMVIFSDEFSQHSGCPKQGSLLQNFCHSIPSFYCNFANFWLPVPRVPTTTTGTISTFFICPNCPNLATLRLRFRSCYLFIFSFSTTLQSPAGWLLL